MKLVRHTVAACACACLFTACGGGGSEATADPSTPAEASASITAPTATAATVPLEGCVLDLNDRPRATAVRALGADGRLVATGRSNAEGVFVLHVPAQSHLTLGLDAPGQETLALLTGSTRLSLGGCLREADA